LGQLELGVYHDNYETAPVEQLNRHYGIYGNEIQRLPGQTGAGHPADEDHDDVDLDAGPDDNDWIDINDANNAIAEAENNVYTEPVSVPGNNNPFASENEMHLFARTLHQHQVQGYIPAGYGMLWDEWEGGVYPTIQMIPSGQRGSKQLRIGLPDNRWRSRSELWVQALDIMIRLAPGV
jgi:hypothetical protein